MSSVSMRRVWVIATVAIVLLLPGVAHFFFPPAEAAGGVVIVSPGLQTSAGWITLSGIFGEGPPGLTKGTQTYVFGPATPPIGSGSLRFDVLINNWSEAIGYTGLNGVPLSAASLTELSYSTFIQQASSTSQDFFVMLVIDLNGDQTPDDYLFFYPANQQGCSNGAPPQHAIAQNQWQQPWDARNGVWVSANGLCNAQNSCGTANDPKTLAEYVACFPTARLINYEPDTPDVLGDERPGLIIGYGGQNVSANFIGFLDNVRVGVNGMTTVFNFEPICTLFCSANIVQSNDPNQCGAVVNYPAPMSSGGCGGTTCSPASGSFFPKGTTSVTCQFVGHSTTETCSLTVTVNDTQAPSITCPANLAVVGPTPGSGAVATYPPPVATDNCPGVMTSCTPPSGSSFSLGTTTVTCTATDTSGNTATCSFTVSTFDGRLQDDSEGCNNTVLFNTVTGDYRWCCHGTTFTGKAKVTRAGNVYTLFQGATDRRVQITLDAGAFSPHGSASLQVPVGTTICTITDRDIRNDTCTCGAVIVGTSPQK